MTKFRLRPSSNYLHEASISDLYTLIQKWKSDINFYKIELDFLKKLIEEHFILLTKNDPIEMINDLLNKINNELGVCNEFSTRIKAQMEKAMLLTENAASTDEKAFRNENSELEDDIVKFKKGEQILKGFIFEEMHGVISSLQLSAPK
ncbi:MAG: hypothetical protein GQ574_15855 [Crocinitomix sp.]|nr:hypothetical protein [Crocinitomix sp.]